MVIQELSELGSNCKKLHTGEAGRLTHMRTSRGVSCARHTGTDLKGNRARCDVCRHATLCKKSMLT